MGWRGLAESGVENAGLITFATEEGERGKKQQQKNGSGGRIRIRKGKKDSGIRRWSGDIGTGAGDKVIELRKKDQRQERVK